MKSALLRENQYAGGTPISLDAWTGGDTGNGSGSSYPTSWNTSGTKTVTGWLGGSSVDAPVNVWVPDFNFSFSNPYMIDSEPKFFNTGPKIYISTNHPNPAALSFDFQITPKEANPRNLKGTNLSVGIGDNALERVVNEVWWYGVPGNLDKSKATAANQYSVLMTVKDGQNTLATVGPKYAAVMYPVAEALGWGKVTTYFHPRAGKFAKEVEGIPGFYRAEMTILDSDRYSLPIQEGKAQYANMVYLEEIRHCSQQEGLLPFSLGGYTDVYVAKGIKFWGGFVGPVIYSYGYSMEEALRESDAVENMLFAQEDQWFSTLDRTYLLESTAKQWAGFETHGVFGNMAVTYPGLGPPPNGTPLHPAFGTAPPPM